MEREVRRRKGINIRRIRNICIAAVLIIAAGVGSFFAIRGRIKENENYISRAVAARMLVLLGTDSPADTGSDSSDWYVKYMNYLSSSGSVEWDSESFTEPEYSYSALTYRELRSILTRNGWNVGKISDYTGIALDKTKGDKRVNKNDFSKIYDYLVLLNGDAGGVVRRELTIVGTPANMTAKQIREYGRWNCVALEGVFDFEGLSIDAYADKKVCVYARGNRVISVLAVVDDEVSYHNVWITEAHDNLLKAYISGVYREYNIAPLDESFTDTIADIGMSDGRVCQLTIKKDTISGKVLRLSNDEIELYGYGNVEIDDNFRVYKSYGELEEKKINDILVGYDLADFVVADGKICAAVIKRELKASNIRVLLMNTGYTSIFHDRITLTSDEGFVIKKGDEIIRVDAGELVDVYPDSEYMSEGRIILEPVGLNNAITVLSIERSCGNPFYYGELEIACENGSLVIINELPLEEYLYHVVPSEMPAGFGVEALKVQAVCARSYAYRHILNNSYRSYGAHVDDSVGYQVYNNIKAQPDSTQAVKETYGQVMVNEGEVVAAYYYSTSCGYMSDLSLWGGESGGIYREKTVNPKGNSMNLSEDEAFKSFIYSTDESDYDYEFPFYRWSVELDRESFGGHINQYLKLRHASDSGNILMKNANGEYETCDEPYIGELLAFETAERTTSGAVRKIIIHGTAGDVMVCGELNIRYVLGPGDEKITTHTQTDTTFEFLPSAYIYIEELYEDGAVTGYRITGGGYGHGIGMSQNAVSAMVKQGMRYDDILEFFYNNIDIMNIY